jgi:hypothetical protein
MCILCEKISYVLVQSIGCSAFQFFIAISSWIEATLPRKKEIGV